ncbi:MAG: hypothetical protein PUE01_03800 [Clostridiaceae bacterium]|nr:hypothetical protein [Clostridiaceae bacterium]
MQNFGIVEYERIEHSFYYELKIAKLSEITIGELITSLSIVAYVINPIEAILGQLNF